MRIRLFCSVMDCETSLSAYSSSSVLCCEHFVDYTETVEAKAALFGAIRTFSQCYFICDGFVILGKWQGVRRSVKTSAYVISAIGIFDGVNLYQKSVDTPNLIQMIIISSAISCIKKD